jgi:hypothetical protein
MINFTDKNKNNYYFNDYREFSLFWFSNSRRYLKSKLDNITFNRLNKYAVNSKDAKKRTENDE